MSIFNCCFRRQVEVNNGQAANVNDAPVEGRASRCPNLSKIIIVAASCFVAYHVFFELKNYAHANLISNNFRHEYQNLGKFEINLRQEAAWVNKWASQEQCPSLFEHMIHQVRNGYSNNLDAGSLRKLFGSERDLSNAEVRHLYEAMVKEISHITGPFAGWQQEGNWQQKTCLDFAAAASEMRSNARLYARERGGFFQHLIAQLRDVFFYFNDNGPRFSSTLVKYAKGTLQQTCAAISTAASRSNKKVTEAIHNGGYFDILKAMFG